LISHVDVPPLAPMHALALDPGQDRAALIAALSALCSSYADLVTISAK
jgi:hypothetical protein